MKGDLPASNQLQSKEEAEKASRNLDAEIQADLEANIDNWLIRRTSIKGPRTHIATEGRGSTVEG